MDRSSVPWSIKGVSKRARRLAKDAATRDGVTMGEWLAGAIRHVDGLEAATHAPAVESPPVAPPARQPYPAHVPPPAAHEPAPAPVAAPVSPPLMAVPSRELEALARQMAESEQRILDLLAPLHDAVQQLAARVEAIEARTPTYYRRLPGQWARPATEDERA